MAAAGAGPRGVNAPLERLRSRVDALGAPLCLGLDPHPDDLPDGIRRDAAGIETFARGVLHAAGPHAAAVKINVAFFEAFGSDGWAALERIRRDVPAELVCILDAKRGDIGPTAERYAEALLGRLDADAVTLSPYLGEDAITPFLARSDRMVYILARTSNPSAGRLQGLEADAAPIHIAVARWVSATWTDGRAGLVVGATEPDELRRVRAAAPGPGFLVPGVGAQGGDLATAIATCQGAWAPGLVNVSRAIAGASPGADWRNAAGAAARAWADRMRDAVLHSNASAAVRPPTEP